jgi:hypothetical protein
MINLLGYREFLNEGRIAISWAKPSTNTTKILSFIDEKERVTKKELGEFLCGIPEDSSGKKPDISWARKNKRYVKYKVQEEEANYYCLTPLGKRVLKSFKMNETYLA